MLSHKVKITICNTDIEFSSDDVPRNDFSEIKGFILFFIKTYLKKVHMQNIGSLVH